MKTGETFELSLLTMMQAHVGHLVETTRDGEKVVARVVSVSEDGAVLKVVPKETRD
jgi:hypothetical protein